MPNGNSQSETRRPSAGAGGRRICPRRDAARAGVLFTVLPALLLAGRASPVEQIGEPSRASRTHARQAQATRPAGRVPFQSGIVIDWSRRAVEVEGRVVLRSGPLEFLACFSGKEHESIVRLDAAGTHIYLALGLLGLEPGRPPEWDDETQVYSAPTGELVDLSFAWEVAGAPHRVPASSWLREIEFHRAPLDRPWVFAGSQRLPDRTLLADRSGAAVGLVDFPDNLLNLSRAHGSANATLWAEANEPTIPPIGTAVRLIIVPARPRRYAIECDFRGELFVDGRYTPLADVADVILLARELTPGYIQEIGARDSLRADVRRVERRLIELEVPREALRID